MSSENDNISDSTPPVQTLSDEITHVISAAIFAGASPDTCMKALVYALAFTAGLLESDEIATFIEEFAHQLPAATKIAESFQATQAAETMAHMVAGTGSTQ